MIDWTPTELDVLECLASGYDVNDMAAELGVTATAIRVQMSRVKAKLGLVTSTRFASTHEYLVSVARKKFRLDTYYLPIFQK